MKPPKTVWHLSSNRWNSAITEYVLSTAVALQRKGVANVVTPLRGSPGERRARKLADEGIRCEALASFHLLAAGPARALLRQVAPDAVICYGGAENAMAAVLGLKAPLWRFRGQSLPTGALRQAILKMGGGSLEQTVVPSEWLRTDMVQKAVAAGKRPIEVIPLGVDEHQFCYRETPGNERPEALILGRLDPVKGHKFALETFAGVLKKWGNDLPRPRLTIVGEAANLSSGDLRRWMAEYSLSEGDDVIVREERVNLQDLLPRMDLGWIPSLDSEVICRVACEFLLSGLAIFVSGVGSLNECFVDPHRSLFGETYRGLSQTETIALLQKQLHERFAEKREVRHQRSLVAKELFSLDRMGERWLSLLGASNK